VACSTTRSRSLFATKCCHWQGFDRVELVVGAVVDAAVVVLVLGMPTVIVGAGGVAIYLQIAAVEVGVGVAGVIKDDDAAAVKIDAVAVDELVIVVCCRRPLVGSCGWVTLARGAWADCTTRCASAALVRELALA